MAIAREVYFSRPFDQNPFYYGTIADRTDLKTVLKRSGQGQQNGYLTFFIFEVGFGKQNRGSVN